MDASNHRHPSTSSWIVHTDVGLLQDTQAYLESQFRRLAPDSLLLHAWQEFYRVYSNLVRRFAIARGVPNAEIDDCVQEVWTEVITRLPDFQHPVSRPGLRAWLYTVVRSKATDRARHRSRHPARSLSEAIQAGQEPSGSESDPAALYEQQWEGAMLQTMLAELRTKVSELNYRVLHMRVIEGCSVQEVATALGLTPKRVRFRQHRMLQKLRSHLALYTGRHFGKGE